MKDTHTRMLLLKWIRQISVRSKMLKRSSLHWDVNELDKVTDEPHDCEPNGNRATKLNVF